MKRSAAPFQLTILPQPLLRRWIALAGALATLSLALALTAHFPGLWPLLWLSPFGGAWSWRCARITPRILRWDGQAWHLHAQVRRGASPAFQPSLDAPAPVRLKVIFDLGFFLLLSAHGASASWCNISYLPLTRSTQTAAWGALRAVLFCARELPR